MLRTWLQWLPVYIYKWIARKYCSNMSISGSIKDGWCQPENDILIKIAKEKD
jgi:hypothetical protein